MATVTGSLKDIVGADMADRVAALFFQLNGPTIQATSTTPGTIHPTEPKKIIPSGDSSFTANLVATTVMLTNSWYTLAIQWNDSAGTLMDFPDWQIRVPVAGGVLSELITLAGRAGGPGGSGPNFTAVLYGLTEPPNLVVGQMWWKTDPNDPYGPKNTGLVYIGGK